MKPVLIITDDTERSSYLSSGVNTFRSCRVHDLYAAAAIEEPCAIVADVAELNVKAVKRLRSLLDGAAQCGPLIVLLSRDGARDRVRALALGADATLSASSTPDRIQAVLEKLEAGAMPEACRTDKQVRAMSAFIRDIFERERPITPVLVDGGTQIVARAVRESGVREWIRIVRRFDDATHQHCLLVAGLAAAFGTFLGLSRTDSHILTKAAVLHDVGKICVPPEILNKPSKLTAAEMAVIRLHPEQGHAMLTGQGFDDVLLTVVRSHHEMLDGSGYPDGLTGTAVPDLVRLVTICDVYAALIEQRPYKPPLAAETAYGIVERMGERLDQALVRAFYPVIAAFEPRPLKALS